MNYQVAVVTGAGSGIGRAIAIALANLGLKVALLGRNLDALNQTQQLIQAQSDSQTLVVKTDVRVAEEVNNAVAAATSELGHVDVLINNAGLGVGHLVEDCPEEDWDLVMDTNAKGTFLMSKAVLPTMQKSGGYIINIASQAAKHGYEKTGPYCAAKFAVVGFAKALQEEVRQHGIKVHSLCPGLVQVPKPVDPQDQTPGWLQVDDLANAVVYLLQQPKGVYIEDIGLFGF